MIAQSLRARWAATLLLAAVQLGGCARAAEEEHTATRRKLRVLLQPYIAMAPLLIADAESLFAKQGLEVEFVRMDNAANALPLLLNGDIDVLPGTIMPGALNAMARGEPIRIVADKGYFAADGCTHIALMARPGLVGSDGASPAVQRVSTDRGASGLYFVRSALLSVGLSLDSMEVVEIPNAPEIEALGSASIDVALAGEPWLSRMVRAKKGVVWIPAQRILPDFQYSLIFFGPNLLQRDRDAGRRFMVAYREAIGMYREGKTPRNIDILAKATGEEPDLVRASCWIAMRPDSRIDLASILEFQKWALAHGYVSTPASAAQVWDSSFVVWADTILSRRTQ